MTKSEYIAQHMWLKYHYGKASMCENTYCPHPNPKRFEWALKKGFKHERKRENYLQLCPSCHAKYDGKNPMLHYKKGSAEKVQEAKYIPVDQYNKKGDFIKTWKGALIVEEELGILKTSINNCLKGLSKTAGGYIWRYSGKK